jgi:large subunit ribosomal protein L1
MHYLASTRWESKYGEETPEAYPLLKLDPTEAEQAFEKEASKPDYDGPRPGVPRPKWLTYAKWQSFKAIDKCRTFRYWTQRHDEQGNDLWGSKKKTLTIMEGLTQMFEAFERAPPNKAYKNGNPNLTVHYHMNLDPRFPDQNIRCSIELPHGTGSALKVAVFCPDEEEADVLAMGAYKAGATLAKSIEDEVLDFDVLIAKPQMMPKLAKLGKVLGPKRLMPSPKAGTVVQDYKTAIDTFSKGSSIEVRMDKDRNLKVNIGNYGMGREKLYENFQALMKGLTDQAPTGARKKYVEYLWMQFYGLPATWVDSSEFPVIVTDDDDEE